MRHAGLFLRDRTQNNPAGGRNRGCTWIPRESVHITLCHNTNVSQTRLLGPSRAIRLHNLGTKRQQTRSGTHLVVGARCLRPLKGEV